MKSATVPIRTSETIKKDEGAERYRSQRVLRWDGIARQQDRWVGWGRYYHHRLEQVYRSVIGTGKRVLEIGCGRGDLLAALKPSRGVGVDFSPEMVSRCRQRHPDLTFVHADAHGLAIEEEFDAIILSDLVNDLWDVQAVLDCLAKCATSQTRIVINSYSRFWEPPLSVAARLGLAKPTLYQNWLTVEDIANLLRLAGFEVIRQWPEIIFPLSIPLFSELCNRYLSRIWPFRVAALTNFIVARRFSTHSAALDEPSVSVIIPARNEAGNIGPILARVPEMGRGTELVFVEGHSKDDTYETIVQEIARHPKRRCQLHRQTGVGKGDAVRLGFARATGDILMILDADMTVPPEDLPRFCEALRSGKAEFVNGVRLVYPMEGEAMRFLNLIGNKLFSVAFSWLLGQSIKDTLCGTKVLWKSDYERIAENRAYFGDFDPFGDFDLIFGAARLNLKIVDLPIRYRERQYGTTNIDRWKHGWLLLKMVVFAAGRIKFV